MIVRGLWRLAKCERAGIGEFGGDIEHFYASLAPLIGIPLGLCLLLALQGGWQFALFLFLTCLVGALLLPVVVYEFARRRGREQYWLRAATALNWSAWMAAPAFVVAVFAGLIMLQCGVEQAQASSMAAGLMLVYLFWYRVFALSAGLGVSLWQAGLLLLLSGIVMLSFTSLPMFFHLGPNLFMPNS